MSDGVFRTICGFCHTNCGVKVEVRKGKISKIEGDPDHPVNRGHLCIKAIAIRELVESKNRLKHPLKKTKGGFVKIPWNEALDLAAERLMSIREKYGSEALFRCAGAPVSYEGRDGFLQFMGVFGSPNLTGVHNLCHTPRAIAFNAAFGGRPEPDYENTELIIFWGVNPINTTRYSSYASYEGFNKIIPRAKERGVKIVVVDPIRSETAAFANLWIRPNIGTDGALGLSMIHTIIQEGLYNKEFVKDWVVGFEEIKKHVETMTPEWAEKITAVPAGLIREFARLYARTEKALIHDGNGLDMHTNGVDMVRTICILIALTGHIDALGGDVFFSLVPQRPLPVRKAGNGWSGAYTYQGATAIATVTKLEKKWMGWDNFPLLPAISFPVVKRALLNHEPDRPKAMIVHHTNPVIIQANEEKTKRALQNLEFLMVVDIFPTGTTEIADLVLPSASDFERLDYRAYPGSRGGFLALREKVIEPVGESRSVFEIEYELAKRMGWEGEYPFRNTEEWINFVLQPANVTVSDLRNNHIIYVSSPVVYKKYLQGGFKTPSGKVECYSEKFKTYNYGALPVFRDPKESQITNPELAKEYSLLGTTRKPAEYVHSKLKNIPALQKRYPNPLVMINPKDAHLRGIKPEHQVEIKSPRGNIKVSAKISEDVTPGLVAIDFGWGNPTDKKASINALTSDEVWDPISGGYPCRLFLCEVGNVAKKGKSKKVKCENGRDEG
jgi:anaerobic selenocysteine-containing dehydrogenase